jgi:hypothetical protein
MSYMYVTEMCLAQGKLIFVICALWSMIFEVGKCRLPRVYQLHTDFESRENRLSKCATLQETNYTGYVGLIGLMATV